MTRADHAEPLPDHADGTLPDAGAIVASVGEVAYEWLIDSDALHWSQNAAAVLCVDRAAIASGRAYAQFVTPKSGRSRFEAVVSAAAKDDGAGVPYRVEYGLRPAAGTETELWIEDTGRWFAGPDGRPLRAHGLVRVINERHEREQHLLYLSRYDGPTGEMNRRFLTKRLHATIEEAVKFRTSCGFLLVSVDNLSHLNEAYGYDIADEVITAVAKRVRSRMRGRDSLGRFSGNKFGVILTNCTPDDMGVAADRLLTAVRDEALQTAAGPVAVTVTIGGVTAPRHARTVRDVIARAQEALDQAKVRHRGSFIAYQPNLERETMRRENVRATDEIIAALNERRVLLAYEPIVGAQSRELAFHECLLRIRRVDGTFIPAQDVVPAAERLGLVRMLDHRVIELAVAKLVAEPDFRASLNVSPASTTDPDWWTALGAMLRAHAGVAERLTVEITEMAAIHDIDTTRGFVARVKDLGCRIAIDDFGAGYTSFRNLRKLGVDMVKIDGAYVLNMLRSADDRAFVQTLIDLSRRLKLATVAEWVQDEEAAGTLAAWGCDYLQGALIGLASLGQPATPPPQPHRGSK